MSIKGIAVKKARKALAVIFVSMFAFYIGAAQAFAANSYIAGFDASGDVTRTDAQV